MFVRKRILILLIFTVAFMFAPKSMVSADSEENVYYMGEVQVKDDAGYGDNKSMKDKDVHHGWELGRFKISGYTRKTNESKPVFLKNVGDKVKLSFELYQDIDKLNDDKDLEIAEDDNGYDEYFQITKKERTNFGRGTLLVKYTDWQNKTSYVEPYTNYLKGVKKGAETKIQFYEEGDYEIALDYEVEKSRWGIIPNSFSHYQILIKFSVRNGNCMVYPFDVNSGSELVNCSFTENGFYLDLAKSRYLELDVKKQNYVEAEGKLVEDTRFNQPASDGQKFIDEGIYIIRVKNLYTDNETEKKIYVGSDQVLKAYVTTGKDIEYIKEMVAEGATIEEDGTITLNNNETIEAKETEDVTSSVDESIKNSEPQSDNKDEKKNDSDNSSIFIIVLLSIIVVLVIYILVSVIRKRRKVPYTNIPDPEENVDETSFTEEDGEDASEKDLEKLEDNLKEVDTKEDEVD